MRGLTLAFGMIAGIVDTDPLRRIEKLEARVLGQLWIVALAAVNTALRVGEGVEGGCVVCEDTCAEQREAGEEGEGGGELHVDVDV
jgi:hypothetical protein